MEESEFLNWATIERLRIYIGTHQGRDYQFCIFNRLNGKEGLYLSIVIIMLKFEVNGHIWCLVKRTKQAENCCHIFEQYREERE